MKFRKKPVVIDAVQWTGKNLDEVVEFLGGRDVDGGHYAGWKPADPSGRADPADAAERSVVFVDTLEGVKYCPVGDWVIRRVRGEFYVCDPETFELTYEAVDEEAPA